MHRLRFKRKCLCTDCKGRNSTFGSWLPFNGCEKSYWLPDSHKDHIGYAKDILATGIKIYTNDETKQLVDSVHGERLYGKPEMKMFEAGDFKVKPFYVPHNGTPNYAYLIEHEEMGKLLFATDFIFRGHSGSND